jgi:uncharacterized protein YdhG (YjbR/CyaY superfamily)
MPISTLPPSEPAVISASTWPADHASERRHDESPQKWRAEVLSEPYWERKEVQGIYGRGTNRDEGARRRAEGDRAPRRGPGKADGENDVLAKIAEMQESDRAMAERLHAIIKASAPALSPKTWYGMPAYARGGDVVCFFQSAQKFKARYATLGFSDKAKLDEGDMWATSFALKNLASTEEARISGLIKKAAS